MSDIEQTFEELGALSRRLTESVRELGRLDEIRVSAEGDFKAAFARAYRDETGASETRKQAAWLACEGLWRTWQLAESVVKVQQAHVRALHSRVEVGRSFFSAQKAEMNFVSSGGGS